MSDEAKWVWLEVCCMGKHRITMCGVCQQKVVDKPFEHGQQLTISTTCVVWQKGAGVLAASPAVCL
jgi:hypothetical protein